MSCTKSGVSFSTPSRKRFRILPIFGRENPSSCLAHCKLVKHVCTDNQLPRCIGLLEALENYLTFATGDAPSPSSASRTQPPDGRDDIHHSFVHGSLVSKDWGSWCFPVAEREVTHLHATDA